MGIGDHQSARSLKEEWLTPQYIIEALGLFDLDPCAPIDRPWPIAAKHYTIMDNGLNQPWKGRVWLNPPYGDKTAHWLSRMVGHNNGIALLFARTETAMFFKHVWRAADAVLFLEGRLHFHHANGQKARANAGGPSVLVAYGNENVGRLRNSGIAGKFIDLREESDDD
jgi:hypothetical protein